MKQIISFTLFALLLTRTSAATLDTTLVGGNGAAGNMFDLCAKTNLEITSLDINCGATGVFTVEIYIATAINEPYAPIVGDSSSWTLIHQQTATCQPVGTLTVLNAFNINTIPALINNGDCRGFYVTQTTGSLKYTDGVSVGSIFASNADLDFKEGIGNGYPFGTTYSPRVWNGRIHYNAGTRAPTSQTTNPTRQPTLQTSAPTLPTTNPTQQPTNSISLCATTPYPTWCYYIDLYPTHSDSTTTVNITDIDRASDVYFNIVFTPRGQLCIDPSITFEYEQIDISATTEYIDIMDNEGSTIQQCQGNGGADSQCNVWWTCVSKYSLGVPQINAEAPYQIQLMASAQMDALCTTLVTNAKLHFQCKGTESPTMEPTFDPSAAPSTQTLAPTTSEPTAPTTNPTQAPTSPTLVPSVPPTLAPTTPISLCAAAPYPTWCYYIDLYPGNAITTTTVNITDTDRGTDVYFNIIFTPRGQLCDNPSISVEYEQIDIELTTAHIDIRNDIDALLSQCQGNGGADRQCNVWWTCLSNYNLGITQIDADTPYRIQLMTTSTNDALCHDLVTNAKLHFTCDGTVSPTMDPTFDPTIEPTLSTSAPTTMAPTAPTTNPSTDPTMEPTIATLQPSLPTANPTPPTYKPSLSPIAAISLCATTPYPTWCYYVDLYPGNAITTTTVNITDIDRNTYVYFNVVFTPRLMPCNNPSISFEYEQIDISSSTEYIEVRNDIGSLLTQCQGNGGADPQCTVWWTCLSNYNLGVSQINEDTSYQIQLRAASANDALCTSYHQWAINARLHFSCDAVTYDPTKRPTQTPSLSASTANPTQIPSTAPTNIASGNVLSTNITAFQSQNEYGKGKGNSNKEFIWIFISVLSVLACINIVCAVFYFNKKRKRLVVKNIANSIIGGETMEDANIENIKGGNECGIELEAVHSENGPEISDDSGEDLYSHNYKSTVKDETETGGNELYGTALTTQMHLTAGKTEGDNSVVTDEGST